MLDALTKSGALSVDFASLHVVIAATHCFDKSIIDTVITVRTGDSFLLFPFTHLQSLRITSIQLRNLRILLSLLHQPSTTPLQPTSLLQSTFQPFEPPHQLACLVMVPMRICWNSRVYHTHPHSSNDVACLEREFLFSFAFFTKVD